jgi:hypothetical protein
VASVGGVVPVAPRGGARVGRRLERKAPGVEIVFLQHAAGAGTEPGKEKGLDERIARMRRRPQMKIRDPVLGAQVFEVQPHRRTRAPRHRGHIDRRQLAGERFDHDIGHRQRVAGMRGFMPMLDRDAEHRLLRAGRVDLGAQLVKRAQIVDEHPHLPAVLGRELPREAPAHADVAEVVDHRAEDVAGDQRGSRSGVGRRAGAGSGSHGGTRGSDAGGMF